MMARYSLSFVLFFLLSVPVFAAKIPMTLEEVPIYPDGIVMSDEWVQDFIKKGKAQRMQEELDGLILKNRSVKIYGVNADPDGDPIGVPVVSGMPWQFYGGKTESDVRAIQKTLQKTVFEKLKKFYLRNLGEKQEELFQNPGLPQLDHKLPDYSKLKPGAVTNVKFGYDKGIYFFGWVKREANNDITLFVISATNANFKDFPGKIIVTITAEIYSKNVVIKIPGEAELGAPVYPGAVYAPKESVGSGVMTTHVFYSSDPAEKVVQFYERQTGIAPLIGNPTSGGKSYMFQGYSKKNRDNWIAVIDNKENSQGKIRIEFVLSQ